MVVVTGATGHIGNVLVRELLKLGKKVRVLQHHTAINWVLADLDIEIINGDICNKKDLQKAFQGAEIVYHLAAIISIFPGMNANLEQVNITGTRNVGEVCLELKIPKLVYVSSVHAIADKAHGLAITEEDPIDPKCAIGKYGRTKAMATREIFHLIQQGLNAVIVQPSGVIGPFDYAPSQLGFVYSLMVKGLNLGVNGGYNFVDVRDVVQGILLAGEKGRIGECYILSGHMITIKEKKKMIDKILQRKHSFYAVPKWLCYIGAFFLSPFYKPFHLTPILTFESLEILYSNADLRYDKAQKELGYTVRPFEETMRDTILWIKDNQHYWHYPKNYKMK